MVIHIKWNNDTNGVILPINPSAFRLSDTMNNTSVIIHNLGEINLKGKRALQSITLESFFPCQKYDFAQDSYHDPYDYYIKKLQKLFEDNTTVHLVITETNINGHFTIESFEYGHEEKNKDVAYSITLKEFREIGSTKAGSSRVEKDKNTKSVTWKKGDTWQKVTKSVLGSSKTYKTQKKNNKSVIDKAIKAYKKKNKVKKVKEATALIGCKVVIKK